MDCAAYLSVYLQNYTLHYHSSSTYCFKLTKVCSFIDDLQAFIRYFYWMYLCLIVEHDFYLSCISLTLHLGFACLDFILVVASSCCIRKNGQRHVQISRCSGIHLAFFFIKKTPKTKTKQNSLLPI